MAALQDPEYYGTMVRVWFEDSGPKPKAFLINSDPELDHEMLTESLSALMVEYGKIICVHFDRITLDLVDKNDEGHDRIKVPALTVETVEVEDEE